MTAEELRRKYKNIRDAISAEDRAKFSDRIVKALTDSWDVSMKGECDFLMYYPKGSEVSLLPLGEWILSKGFNLYFPVTKKDGIHFYQVHDLDGFTEGSFGVMEPVDRSNEFIKTVGGVSFTPGLVFDRHLHRVGYGGGYYDRFYQRYPDIVRVGVCFSSCLAEDIVHEDWDKRMSVCVTEKEVIR